VCCILWLHLFNFVVAVAQQQQLQLQQQQQKRSNAFNKVRLLFINIYDCPEMIMMIMMMNRKASVGLVNCLEAL